MISKKSNRRRIPHLSLPQARRVVRKSTHDPKLQHKAEQLPLPGFESDWFVWDSKGIQELSVKEVNRILGIKVEAHE